MVFKSAWLVFFFFFVKQVNFHDYTFFYSQFHLKIRHVFTKHITGRCEVLAILKLRRRDLLSQGPTF